jgi:hypothetical protein
MALLTAAAKPQGLKHGGFCSKFGHEAKIAGIRKEISLRDSIAIPHGLDNTFPSLDFIGEGLAQCLPFVMFRRTVMKY